MIAAAWGQYPVAEISARAVYAILAGASFASFGAFFVLLEVDRLVGGWRARRRDRRRGGMITIAGPLEPRPKRKRAA